MTKPLPVIPENHQIDVLRSLHEVLLPPIKDATVLKGANDDLKRFLTMEIDQLNTVNHALYFISKQPVTAQFQMLGAMSMLHQLGFPKLPANEREKLLMKWKSSTDPAEVGLFTLCVTLTSLPVCRSSRYIHDAMGYCGMNPKKPEHTERLKMLDYLDEKDTDAYDVIIVGSGAGGGVVAAELSASGKRVLVIEQSKYYHESEMPRTEAEAFDNMYTDGYLTMCPGMLVIGGKVFGGGTTVNYLASFKTPAHVRQSWKDMLGLDFYVSEEYDSCLQEVTKRIGATTEGINHNKVNRKLIDGAKALNYHIDDIPQNTGGKPHDDGWCFSGCAWAVKNGSMNTYLRDAAKHGTKFIDRTRVTRVLHENGLVKGVECERDGKTYTLNAEKVVVAGGALYSPCLLQASEIPNPNIGQHLSLHPLATVLALYAEDVNMHEGSLMTAYSKVDLERHELDPNDAFPCIIEAFSMHPGFFGALLPFESPETHRQNLCRYKKAVNMMVLQRDNGPGTVKMVNNDLQLTYQASEHDKANLLAGTIQSCEIAVASGAVMVNTSQSNVPPFNFHDDETPSVDNPRFREWIDLVKRTGFQDGLHSFASGHQMGTCRIGSSPENSVANQYGESWDVKGLYIADGSAVPTGIGYNPMVTIEATALWVAKNIVNNRNGHV